MPNVFGTLKENITVISLLIILILLVPVLVVSGYQLDMPFLQGGYFIWKEIHGFVGYVFISLIALKAYINRQNLYNMDLFIALLAAISLASGKLSSFGSAENVIAFRSLHIFVSTILLSMLVFRLYISFENKKVK